MQIKGIKNIIWDWNGTLLDDIDICIECMNDMLGKRQLQPISKSRYLEIFTFPVKDYYSSAGIDFQKYPFEKTGIEFIKAYQKKLPDCHIHNDAADIIEYFHSKSYKQIILSAMEENALQKSVSKFNILKYFDGIYGIQDHYANGKEDIAKKMMRINKLLPSESIIIGDTLHDAEIAQSISVSCILISNGHQSADRLRKGNTITLKKLGDLKKFL